MNNTPSETESEILSLTNTCSKHAERAARSAECAEGSEKRAYHAKLTAENAAFRATLMGDEAKAAVIVAREYAQRARKAMLAIMLALMGAILAFAAIHFFTH